MANTFSSASHTSKPLTLEAYLDILRSDSFIQYLRQHTAGKLDTYRQEYHNYVEEASFGFRLLSEYEPTGKRMLEVGGGVGILSCWLYLSGHDITAIEPSAIGYTFHHDIQRAIWQYFNVPEQRFRDMTAEDLDPAVLGQFDLIFSINVIEHINRSTLPLAFQKMKSVLADGGLMVHHCPNYHVPFEPHYGLFLVPFNPQLTGKMKGIQQEGVWQSLNFVTSTDIQAFASGAGLQVDFERALLKKSFERFDHDAEFARRHPALVNVQKLLKATGLLYLMGKIPPSMCTPMTFRLRKRGE